MGGVTLANPASPRQCAARVLLADRPGPPSLACDFEVACRVPLRLTPADVGGWLRSENSSSALEEEEEGSEALSSVSYPSLLRFDQLPGGGEILLGDLFLERSAG